MSKSKEQTTEVERELITEREHGAVGEMYGAIAGLRHDLQTRAADESRPILSRLITMCLHDIDVLRDLLDDVRDDLSLIEESLHEGRKLEAGS